MSNLGDSTDPKDGEQSGSNDPGNEAGQPSQENSSPLPKRRDAPSPPVRNGPFPVRVEDCPDEDGVLVGDPSRRPPPATTPVSPTTSSIPLEKEMHAREEPQEIHTASMHDSPLPPFIQLQGPPPQAEHQPEAFRYLDADSPAITSESIRRSVDNSGAGKRRSNSHHPVSPSALSHSSVASSHPSDVFSHGTRTSESHRSWSPEDVVPPRGPGVVPFSPQPGRELPPNYASHSPHSPVSGFPQGSPTWHASPEMAYGNMNPTPFSGHAAAGMQQPYFGHNMAQPPPPPPPLGPQHPPLTGYQLLALKLTGSLYGYPVVTPIYRRFEALNHRLLLQLQDEIVELEQQLNDIDAADTNARAMPMGFMPASRRSESMAQGELGWQKQEILGSIGWRLTQYNKIISSFKETQYLPTPTHQEIEDYRGFFARGGTIAEPETRFLDDTNDLISLAPADWDESPPDVQHGKAGDSTPTPQTSSVVGSPPPARPKSTVQPTGSKPPHRPVVLRSRSPMYIAYAAIIAVLVPILTFVFIPGFLERMVIVVLVFSGVGTAVVQSGMLARLPNRGVLDCVICAGLYGAVMAVVANIVA